MWDNFIIPASRFSGSPGISGTTRYIHPRGMRQIVGAASLRQHVIR